MCPSADGADGGNRASREVEGMFLVSVAREEWERLRDCGVFFEEREAVASAARDRSRSALARSRFSS